MPKIRHSFVSAKSDGSDSTLVRASNWNANLQYTDGSGAPSGTDVTVREVLSADRTYYVRSDGNDNNTGLVDSSGGAFLTLQGAYDTISSVLDFGGHTVTIVLQASTTFTRLVISGGWGGGGVLAIRGTAGGSGTIISDANSCIEIGAALFGTLYLYNLKFISSAGNGIFVNASATVSLQTGLEFGACSSAHIAANAPGANIQLGSPYTVSGNASAHWQALGLSKLTANGSTVTFSGTITFSGPFAYASRLGYIDAEALTFVNSFTGQRYHADTNGVITTFTGNSNYFPGTIAGDVATGGVYN